MPDLPRLRRLLPPDALHYTGPRTPVASLALYNTAATARSLVHMFAPDGGAHTIAGIPTDVTGGDNIIALFGQWGAEQLLITALTWIVLIRYRGLIPLMIATALTDQVLRLLIGQLKPLTSEHTPPGALGTWIMLPLLVIILTASLTQPRQQTPTTPGSRPSKASEVLGQS
ncbi:hypothetical protein ACF1GY_37065 [Streptomyces sp. NPDC014684]|uniref:hypothetical protein n=1 Tax=Streptomyces sp. NPDC014684 TaxID=3364880 RepID=UPI0036F561BD